MNVTYILYIIQWVSLIVENVKVSPDNSGNESVEMINKIQLNFFDRIT